MVASLRPLSLLSESPHSFLAVSPPPSEFPLQQRLLRALCIAEQRFTIGATLLGLTGFLHDNYYRISLGEYALIAQVEAQLCSSAQKSESSLLARQLPLVAAAFFRTGNAELERIPPAGSDIRDAIEQLHLPLPSVSTAESPLDVWRAFAARWPHRVERDDLRIELTEWAREATDAPMALFVAEAIAELHGYRDSCLDAVLNALPNSDVALSVLQLSVTEDDSDQWEWLERLSDPVVGPRFMRIWRGCLSTGLRESFLESLFRSSLPLALRICLIHAGIERLPTLPIDRIAPLLSCLNLYIPLVSQNSGRPSPQDGAPAALDDLGCVDEHSLRSPALHLPPPAGPPTQVLKHERYSEQANQEVLLVQLQALRALLYSREWSLNSFRALYYETIQIASDPAPQFVRHTATLCADLDYFDATCDLPLTSYLSDGSNLSEVKLASTIIDAISMLTSDIAAFQRELSRGQALSPGKGLHLKRRRDALHEGVIIFLRHMDHPACAPLLERLNSIVPPIVPIPIPAPIVLSPSSTQVAELFACDDTPIEGDGNWYGSPEPDLMISFPTPPTRPPSPQAAGSSSAAAEEMESDGFWYGGS